MEISRPVWAEINLNHLAHNMREVRRLTDQKALVTAVIKADGYGHGAAEIGQVLLDNGADRFAVATLSEALQLKKYYPKTPIMVLGYTPNHSIHEAIEEGIIVTLFDYAQAQYFNSVAQVKGSKLLVHLKLDTGMGRLGFACNEQTISDIVSIKAFENIVLEGLYTHFACADETDKTTTHNQMKNFFWIRQGLEDKGVTFSIYHACNSAGIIDLPEYHMDMVRAGIMLYGLWPSNEVDHTKLVLKEVMSLKAQLAHVKQVPAATGISYGHKYVTPTEQRIGTLPLGYADGFTRLLTFKAEVLLKGHRLPVVGRICMDQCMIDLSDVPAAQGDEVVLFGQQGDALISIDEVANKLGTINYEVVCMMNKRIVRVYTADGVVIQTKDAVRLL